MRVGSLFSGIGGLDLGLGRAGMEIVWQVENDDWCTRVLERHWPDVARFRDVRDCHGALAHAERKRRRAGQLDLSGQSQPDTTGCCLDHVDLICGGFPCQSVSHAGRRMGESDSRWLWPEFYRIICEVRPRWVLAENVPGLLSMDSGRLFGGILRDLSEAGYDAVWFVLSAADVGAPHLRERVFVVAHANEHRPHGAAEPQREHETVGRGEQPGRDGSDGEVADTSGTRLQARHERRGVAAQATGILQGRELVGGDTEEARRWWTVEPDVGRVAHGIPSRVDRLRGLGNAVVPQVAEVIGRWILTSGGN